MYDDSVISRVAGVISGESRVAEENAVRALKPVHRDGVNVECVGIPLTKLLLHIVLQSGPRCGSSEPFRVKSTGSVGKGEGQPGLIVVRIEPRDLVLDLNIAASRF